METYRLRLTGRHEERLYEVLRKVGGFRIKSLEDSFRDLKMDYAIQIRSLLPSLLQLCEVASAGAWGGKSSRLGLVVRLLVFATGVTSENFTFSSYLALLSAFKQVTNNLRGILELETRRNEFSQDYVIFCIDRIASLRRNLISLADNQMPWAESDSLDKFSSLPRDCFRYIIKNFLYNPRDLLSLALTNKTFFSLVFDCSLWDELLHTHSPLDTDYRTILPIGIVVDNYSVVCYVIKFYHERYNRKYVRDQEVLLRKCVTCHVFFWVFQTRLSYNHILFCPASYFVDYTAKDFVLHLHMSDR